MPSAKFWNVGAALFRTTYNGRRGTHGQKQWGPNSSHREECPREQNCTASSCKEHLSLQTFQQWLGDLPREAAHGFPALNKRFERGGLQLQESMPVPLHSLGTGLALNKTLSRPGPLCGRALRGPVHCLPDQLLTVTCICNGDSEESGHQFKVTFYCPQGWSIYNYF